MEASHHDEKKSNSWWISRSFLGALELPQFESRETDVIIIILAFWTATISDVVSLAPPPPCDWQAPTRWKPFWCDKRHTFGCHSSHFLFFLSPVTRRYNQILTIFLIFLHCIIHIPRSVLQFIHFINIKKKKNPAGSKVKKNRCAGKPSVLRCCIQWALCSAVCLTVRSCVDKVLLCRLSLKWHCFKTQRQTNSLRKRLLNVFNMKINNRPVCFRC